MLIIPPAKRSFRGVYCFQSVRNSVIPSFRHSVNILTSLLNNLSSFCPMFFKFSTHLHHKTTPAKRSFRGVYCFQSVRNSVIPSFRHSVNILTSLLNNLSSFCPMFFKFSTHLHHKTTHVWYEFRGQRVSFARVMGLFKPIHRMFAIVLIVHTL